MLDSAKHWSRRLTSDMREWPAGVTGHPESEWLVAVVSFLQRISNDAATDVFHDGPGLWPQSRILSDRNSMTEVKDTDRR